MPGWRITSFDRALARGTCASGVGTLSFDASVALVDDFAIGEEVDVSLRPRSGGTAPHEVTRIAPTNWRVPFTAPTLPGLRAEIDRFFPEIAGRRAWLVGGDDECVRIGVEDDTYRPMRALAFGGPAFVQCATELDSIAAMHAFAPADVAHVAPELVRHWPAIPDGCAVFRIDPPRFGDAAAYVIARSVALVPL